MASPTQQTRTEAVAVFDDAATLQEAIDELLSSGFDRAELSLLASEEAVEEKLRSAYTQSDHVAFVLLNALKAQGVCH